MPNRETEPQVERPVAYARISQDRYGAGVNARTQLQDIRKLVSRLGWPEPEEVIDNDLSAYNRRKPRPGYRDLCDGIRSGRWDSLLIWHADRLHRRTGELEGFIELVEETGVKIKCYIGGDLDLETPGGQRNAKILGAVAEAESKEKAERIKKKARYTLAHGKKLGGPRIFGWENDQVTVRPSEAAIIRELTRRVIAGESSTSLARELNRRGVPLTGLERLQKKADRITADIEKELDEDSRAALGEELGRTEVKIAAYSGHWTASMVRHIVIRPRNCGLQPRQIRDRHGKVTGREATEIVGEWAPVVSRQEWELAESILTDPSRSTVREGRVDRYLLTGLMMCGKCGATLGGAGSKPDGPRYGCRVCFGVSRSREMCDQLVLRFMAFALPLLQVKAHEPGAVVSDDHAIEEQLNVRRAKLAELFAAGDIDEEALKAGTARIRDQLANTRRDRAVSLRPSPARGVDAENFMSLPQQRQRAIIAELIDITLLPQQSGGKFDPSKVSIIPRDGTDLTVIKDAIERVSREVVTLDRITRASKRGPQPRREISCDVCGKTVMTGNSRGRYCSQKCRYEARKAGIGGPARERTHERTCAICGSTFMAAKSTTMYCSSRCHSKSHALRVAAGKAVTRDKIFKRRCRMCLEPFESAREGALYCSANCRAAAVRDRRAKGLPAAGNPGAGVKAAYVQKCDVCARQYMSAKRVGPFYCSPTCRSTAYYRANRDKVLAQRADAYRQRKAAKPKRRKEATT